MKAAYVDSSCIVAIGFGERGSDKLSNHLKHFDQLVSSNLLEAEVLSALARENVEDGSELISWVT